MTTAQKPDALPVVAWRKHLSGAEWKVADYVLPDSEPLVRLSDAQSSLLAKEAECEALREDAARYRWLRHGDNDEKVLRQYGDTADTVYLPRNAHLDAAIDAARAAADQGGAL